jgi:hypothetical protein
MVRGTLAAVSVAASEIDPNKLSSEFNHHMAGWALVGVGLLVLVGLVSNRFKSLRYVWPALFVLAGIFLAAWSDAEIWPRGNLSWMWLLHHDQEARQHKIYALILLAIGTVEYLRARGTLNRFWQIWAFPLLAVIGAGLLLIHDHTAGSGAHSPEARAYLVNPALDPDGNPWPAVASADSTANSPMPMDHSKMNHSDVDHSAMQMDHASMPMDHSGMQMDHSSMPMEQPATATPAAEHHHHHMTPSMLLVEREHFWFMVVGIALALFKLISDAGIWHRRFVPYVWPSGMMLLGILLVFYRE